MRKQTKAKCAAQHFGCWSVEPKWMTTALEMIRAGQWLPEEPEDDAEDEMPLDDSGMATLFVDGHLTKGKSSFGGTSTVELRRQLRECAADDAVKGVLLVIDSPGGTVAGNDDLAQDLAKLAAVKPTAAYIEDLGCSAAYWLACQCHTITANRTALVGSIGTVCVVEDTSRRAELAGVKVHVVSTGAHKGAFADGAPVTPEQLSELRREVEALNAVFLSAVLAGRGAKLDKPLEEIADGRVWIASDAKQLGLIDDVASVEAAAEALHERIERMNAESFKTYAAEHPEAAQGFIEQGKKLGRVEAVEELKQAIAAAPGKLETAVAGFIAGQSPEQIAFAHATAEKAVAEALAAERAKVAAAIVPGQVALVTTGSVATVELTPQAQAQAEWDAMSEEAHNRWIDAATFVKVRAAELK